MGVYSTMEVSREWAIEKATEALENIDSLSNEKLEEILFCLLRDKYGANFTVSAEQENKYCPLCGSDNVGEKDYHDDMDGKLYCYNCKERFDRWKW